MVESSSLLENQLTCSEAKDLSLLYLEKNINKRCFSQIKNIQSFFFNNFKFKSLRGYLEKSKVS